MGSRPTRPEGYKRCRPRESGDPRRVDSRFHGYDVTLYRAKRRAQGDSAPGQNPIPKKQSHKALTPESRYMAPAIRLQA